MRVAVLGATGVFGERLCRLLARDGHDLILVARSPAPLQRLASELGAEALSLDRRGDLGPLFARAPEVVVDAAGPFQSYGADPYRLPRACLAAGAHYLDLCDDCGFCAGITALDAAARAAGRFALSGVSSVPALSSAAVAALAEDLDTIDRIDSAILPGNRAPRGRAVIAAILGQVGRPLRVWRGGAWDEARGWSAPRRYDLPGGVTRRGWLIGVPDLVLFPARFGARSVLFRAGLELGVMNQALALLSWLRTALPIPAPSGLMHRLASLLRPFGSDRGGMVVEVTGRRAGQGVTRRWRLLAEAGEGPFIPALPVRALLRDAPAIPPGARPALAELPLASFAAALSDLAVTTDRDETPRAPLFPALLGPAFDGLPPAVRDSHATLADLRLTGRADITRGRGAWPGLIALLFRFPPAGRDVPVTVLKSREGDRELWERRFGPRRFRSVLRPEGGAMTERFGPVTFTLGLAVADGALHFPVSAARAGPLPLPAWALPVSHARETAEDGRFRFDVAIHAPLTGALIVRYRGWLVPVEAPCQSPAEAQGCPPGGPTCTASTMPPRGGSSSTPTP
ncbi:SDR family oxidoreductase [Roseicyclus persicicus]|uniref:DUF4166 domain-containing protein n=1 Tax=Roseicyclus persicicus TaxID=2650661 RepID=A0A7X6GZH4_9RHOB|nr:DUF4166 domain-containing protein [Roseibacterium persicicum]NKX43957.1 DUF4166 domain-containing protein [Roseibacterium persicicum]